ncbi:hypothetical protein BJV77DRAFT_1059012 [Russula vinacea]|nr:hypothetical protein BJV77DRAFT_1059012 [Russula vinacea]
MPSSPYVFYGLTTVRALSVVAILLAFASSIVAMVSDVRAVNRSQHEPPSSDGACGYIGGSTVPNQPAGVFWAVVNRLFIIFQLVFLLLSEISWPMAFFDRFFRSSGLIGATILSHHVDEFTLVSAFFLFSVGCLNITLGLIFREQAKSKRSIRAWRAGGNDNISTPKFRPSRFGGKPGDDSDRDDRSSGFGFGKQGEKQAGLKGTR